MKVKYLFLIAIIMGLFVACPPANKPEPDKPETNKELSLEELLKVQKMVTIKSVSNIELGGAQWQEENPQRTVSLKAYEISDSLVTQGLFQKVMGFNPSQFNSDPAEGDIQELRPVDSVNWYTAVEFCNKLTEQVMGKEHCVYTIEVKKRLTAEEAKEKAAMGMAEGIRSATVTIDTSKKGFRLPTHDEWEWAAGCGDNSKYAGSDNLDDVAWHLDNSGEKTHQVKKLKPNKFGLYDMLGNLWEWCGDLEDKTSEADDTKTTVQKGACCLCPHDPYKNIYTTQSVQNKFFLNVAREKSGFRIARNAE